MPKGIHGYQPRCTIVENGRRCPNPVKARDRCQKHYARWRLTGRDDLKSKEERFWEKVHKDGPLPTWAPFLGPCWIWDACKDDLTKYAGSFRAGGREAPAPAAYRYSYELEFGQIPDGLTIDHLCRVPACVRPDHLEAVPIRENLLRAPTFQGENARKTHCIRGHPFDEANTMYRKIPGSGGVGRTCRECSREKTRRWRARQKGEGTGCG